MFFSYEKYFFSQKRLFFSLVGKLVSWHLMIRSLRRFKHIQTPLLVEGSLEVKLPTIWTDGKAEVGRVREEKKKEDQRRERMRRKKTHEREKVEKSRNTLFFQWFVMIYGSGGSKSRLAKAAGAKSKVLKNWQVRSIFGSWDVEKVHAVAAQRCAKHIWKSKVLKTEAFGAKSTFGSQKCEKLTGSERRAHFEVKNVKNWQVRIIFGSWDVEKVHTVVARSTFGSWDVQKVHAGVARSIFPSQNVQNTPAPDHFWKLRCRKSARCCGTKHISKSKF